MRIPLALRPPQTSAVFLTLACATLGGLTAAYVGWVGDSPLRIAFLPLAVVLAVMLAVDRRRLFFVIMLFRAVGDPVFDAGKFDLGGASIGMGAALNALIIFLAVLFLVEATQSQQSRSLARWSPLLLLPALAGAVHSPEPASAIRTFLVLLSYGAAFIIPFVSVRSAAERDRWLDVVLWSSPLTVLYACVDLAQGWGGEGFRLKSSFSHPNIFAFYLVLVLSLCLHRLKAAAVAPSALLGRTLPFYMLVLLALLALTQTRSAWLAALLVFGIYGLRFERRFLLYLLLLPCALLLLPGMAERILDLSATSVYDPYAKLNSFAWRQEIWKSGLAWMSLSHVPLGYGLNAFTHYSPAFFPLAGNTNPGAHNVYVQMLFETGLAGLAAAAWLFYRLIRRLARSNEAVGATILVSLVSAYLLVCASDNMIDYLSFNWYFWFAMGAACALGRTRTGENHERNHEPANR